MTRIIGGILFLFSVFSIVVILLNAIGSVDVKSIAPFWIIAVVCGVVGVGLSLSDEF